MKFVVIEPVISEDTEGGPREIEEVWGPFTTKESALGFLSGLPLPERNEAQVCRLKGSRSRRASL